jgi:hypothetical protein
MITRVIDGENAILLEYSEYSMKITKLKDHPEKSRVTLP